MSTSEVVKKRGRPKKIISDPIPVEKPEPVKKTATRQKSTKTSSEPLPVTTQTKTTKTTKATPTKNVSPTEKLAPKAASKTTTATSTRSTSIAPKPSPPPQAPNPASTVTVTPENSKILSKVRELEDNPRNRPETIASTPKTPSGSINATTISTPAPSPTPQTQSAKTVPEPTSLPPKPTQNEKPSPSLPKAPSATSPTNNPVPPKESPPAAKPRIPIAEMNSSIVSQLTSRSGARPSPKVKQQLPPGYSVAARRVTLTMIALPIAIVTSYVLYQRLVLGVDERKHLVRPGLVKVDQVESEKGGEES